MARKTNPETKELRALARELQNLGKEGSEVRRLGRDQFKKIAARHDFSRIVKMKAGPDKSAAMAAMAADVRDAIRKISKKSKVASIEEILNDKVKELLKVPGGREEYREIARKKRRVSGKLRNLEEVLKSRKSASRRDALAKVVKEVHETIQDLRVSSALAAGGRGRAQMRRIRSGEVADPMPERRLAREQVTVFEEVPEREEMGITLPEGRRPVRKAKKKAKKKSAKKASSRKKKEEKSVLDQSEGTYNGFKYKLKQQLIGHNERTGAPIYGWYGFVTKQARHVIPRGIKGEVDIHDHPDLKRPFTGSAGKSAAESAVKRAINSTLFFYQSRGIEPLEKGKHSPKKAAEVTARLTRALDQARKLLQGLGDWGEDEWRRIVRKHKPKTIAEMENSASKHLKIRNMIADVKSGIKKVKERKAKASARRAGERRAKKAPKKREPRAVAALGPGRRVEWKPNPTPSAWIRKGQTNESAFRKLRAGWEKAYKGGKVEFGDMMKGYDHLWIAESSYSAGGDIDNAKSVKDERVALRKSVISVFTQCIKELRHKETVRRVSGGSSASSNPTKSQHKAIGQRFLKKSEKAWDRYCENGCKLKDLLDAYEDLSIAYEELRHAGDRKGMAQAKAGIKAARAEIASLAK